MRSRVGAMALFRRSEATDPRLVSLMEEAGGNVERSCLLLRDLLAEFPERQELAAALVECEHEGDRIAHDIIYRVSGENGRRIPSDAQDWQTLATALDAEAAPDRLGMLVERSADLLQSIAPSRCIDQRVCRHSRSIGMAKRAVDVKRRAGQDVRRENGSVNVARRFQRQLRHQA